MVTVLAGILALAMSIDATAGAVLLNGDFESPFLSPGTPHVGSMVAKPSVGGPSAVTVLIWFWRNGKRHQDDNRLT